MFPYKLVTSLNLSSHFKDVVFWCYQQEREREKKKIRTGNKKEWSMKNARQTYIHPWNQSTHIQRHTPHPADQVFFSRFTILLPEIIFTSLCHIDLLKLRKYICLYFRDEALEFFFFFFFKSAPATFKKSFQPVKIAF